ncbi:protoporphyrinogen oxidase [Sporolactobacillus sp. THM7-7]|nr:protoporphyrinogen oxidase [Sporolactobacillus sp. THM7-7]
MPKVKEIVVVGGGITGLSAAYYLRETAEKRHLPLRISLFEASGRLGGKIATLKRDGFVIERGPDSFLKRKKAALELVHDLGLDDQLVDNRTGTSYILKKGCLYPIPEGSIMGLPGKFKPFLESNLLSLDGKAQVLEELAEPPSGSFDDLSVGDFFEKRFGREMVDNIIAPLLSGVYGGDLYRLSLAATLPQFKKIAERSDSLLRAIHGMALKKRTAQFATLKNGLSALVMRLAGELSGMCETDAPVRTIQRDAGGKWRLTLSAGRKEAADALILATPLETVQSFFPELGALRRPNAVPNTSMATIAMAFDKRAVTIDQDGTGFVAQKNEPLPIAAVTWTHLKWPHTTPDGKALLRTFIGGFGREALLQESDSALIDLSIKSLQSIKGIKIERKPDFSVVTRLERSMPQYTVGHISWLKTLKQSIRAINPKIRLAGMSFDGIGLPDCIRQGKEAAEDLITACFP